MRIKAGMAAILVPTAGIIGLAGSEAAASPASPAGAPPVARHITGTAGNSGQLICGINTRTKTAPGSIDMVLNHAPAGQLLVRLQDAKTGQFFSEQKMVKAGMAMTDLVADVLTGTQFRVCTASPIGSPGGPYDANLSY